MPLRLSRQPAARLGVRHDATTDSTPGIEAVQNLSVAGDPLVAVTAAASRRIRIIYVDDRLPLT